jgi:glycosyltransferase involved in cell wall biosynthesis
MDQAKDNKKLHVVYLGEVGFPYGLASIQKMILISKALISDGAKVTVINRKGAFDPEKPIDLPLEGEFEGIYYKYTSPSIYKSKGFLKRNIEKLKGIFGEFNYIRKLRKNKELDAGIISCYHFGQVFLYRMYSLFLGFPVVYNYVEMASAMEHRRGVIRKINDYLFERLLVGSMAGSLPISQVLIENYQKIAPGKSYLKIPILSDFDKFDIPKKEPEHPHFLYCGALDYKEVIDFVLKAYDLLPSDIDTHLYLVLGGGAKSTYEKLLHEVSKMEKASMVKVIHNVPHAQIPVYYSQATALLIPMRPTVQDAARFPHKIAEYVASGNPMISVNYGEVTQYFHDGVDGLIAEDYKPELYAEKMQFVLDHPEEAKKIGLKGKELGLKEFNYLNYGSKLTTFLGGLSK